MHYFEDGEWVDIANPPDRPYDMFAAAKDQLWVTSVENGGLEYAVQLWDGQAWHDGAQLWPELQASNRWREVDGTGPNDVWLLSSHPDQSELLAHFDGESWTIIESPARLHGWWYGTKLEVGPDGLFAYDGLRIWRYAFCEIP
jgi:hypothetical protein